MRTLAYTYQELDEIFRGDRAAGYVGMSAIDGLVAALVCGPSSPNPHDWLPLIFKGNAACHRWLQ